MADEGQTRRHLIAGLGAASGAAVLGGGLGQLADASTPVAQPSDVQFPHPSTPAAALRLLLEGNARYRLGRVELRDYSPVGERIASSQKPFAAIITCSDSRLSPALIFDIESGNLFVSRIAGNTIDTGTLGSTEYAIAVLGAKLIMVLGHSDCGAVNAAIKVVKGQASYPASKYGAIGSFINPILPAVRALPPSNRKLEPAISENARRAANDIKSKGPIIKPAIDSGKVGIVAAVYDIKSGRVGLL